MKCWRMYINGKKQKKPSKRPQAGLAWLVLRFSENSVFEQYFIKTAQKGLKTRIWPNAQLYTGPAVCIFSRHFRQP